MIPFRAKYNSSGRVDFGSNKRTTARLFYQRYVAFIRVFTYLVDSLVSLH